MYLQPKEASVTGLKYITYSTVQHSRCHTKVIYYLAQINNDSVFRIYSIML